MKWKIEKKGEPAEYFDPNEVTLLLYDCKLVNRRSAADKIFAGGHKTVCAWISCDRIQIRPANIATVLGSELFYDPRKTPHWTDLSGKDLDNLEIRGIYSVAKKLFQVV